MAYTEQITFLLFLRISDELTRPPYNRPAMLERIGRIATIAKSPKMPKNKARRGRQSVMLGGAVDAASLGSERERP
jgi:hypothetical protein